MDKLNEQQTVSNPLEHVVSSELKTQASVMANHLKSKGFSDFDQDWLYDQILDALEAGY